MDVKTFNKRLSGIRIEKNFDALYKEYFPRIVYHIKAKFRNTDLAYDVANECFVALLTNKYDYIEFPTAYLYRMSDHIASRILHKEESDLENIDDYANSLSYLDNIDLDPFGDLQLVISRESEKTKKLIYLMYVEGYSMRDSAAVLGLSYEAAKKRHQVLAKKVKKFVIHFPKTQ